MQNNSFVEDGTITIPASGGEVVIASAHDKQFAYDEFLTPPYPA